MTRPRLRTARVVLSYGPVVHQVSTAHAVLTSNRRQPRSPGGPRCRRTAERLLHVVSRPHQLSGNRVRYAGPSSHFGTRVVQPPMPVSEKNSLRQRWSSRSVPSSAEVTVVEPVARAPRSVIQVCSARTTTPTARGCR